MRVGVWPHTRKARYTFPSKHPRQPGVQHLLELIQIHNYVDVGMCLHAFLQMALL